MLKKFTINPMLNMDTLEWVSNDGIVYEESGWEFGGASTDARISQADQLAFMQTLQGEQQTQYAEQSQELGLIKSIMEPILKAGPGQLGYTPAENAAIRSEITNQGSEATAHTEEAALLREKQEAGGAPVLPSGATESLNQQAEILGQQNTANQLTKETVQNYETGRENFLNATQAEEGVAGMQNPVGYAGAAINAGGQATNAINLVGQQQNGLLQSVLGGVSSGVEAAAMA